MSFTYKPLLKLLIDRGLSREELRRRIGAGPSTFAHLVKGEYVSLSVLDRICNELQVSIEEVIEHLPDQEKQE